MATREVPPSGVSALPHSASPIILAFQQLSPGRASASLGRGDAQWVWQGSSPVCRNPGECLCLASPMFSYLLDGQSVACSALEAHRET